MNHVANRRHFLAWAGAGGAALALGTPSPALAFAEGANAAALPPLKPELLERTIAGLPNEVAVGAQVRVLGDAGQWSGVSGKADLRTGAPVPLDGHFRVGSITKTFLATVVLQLAARNRIDLNRPIQSYLPGVVPAMFQPATVAQLLNHTSGISGTPPYSFKDPTWFFANRFASFTTAQVVRLFLVEGEPKQQFAPGSAQSYNGLNYHLLGMLVDRVAGDFRREIRNRILRPLGLCDTYLPHTDASVPRPHARGYEEVDGRLEDITEFNPSRHGAQGEMISTAADLDRFLYALFRHRLLPPAMLDRMLHIPEDLRDVSGRPAIRTMGLARITFPNGVTVYGHTGEAPGYTSGVAVTRDLRRRVAYSVTTTHMNRTPPPMINQLPLAVFAP